MGIVDFGIPFDKFVVETYSQYHKMDLSTEMG